MQNTTNLMKLGRQAEHRHRKNPLDYDADPDQFLKNCESAQCIGKERALQVCHSSLSLNLQDLLSLAQQISFSSFFCSFLDLKQLGDEQHSLTNTVRFSILDEFLDVSTLVMLTEPLGF